MERWCLIALRRRRNRLGSRWYRTGAFWRGYSSRRASRRQAAVLGNVLNHWNEAVGDAALIVLISAFEHSAPV
jgi:hypothetical protein